MVEKEAVEQAEAKLASYESKNFENIVQNDARKVCSIRSAEFARHLHPIQPIRHHDTHAVDDTDPYCITYA